MIVAAVAGGKKSGKTETAEALVRGLTKQGSRVAMAKHVQGKEFTVDARARAPPGTCRKPSMNQIGKPSTIRQLQRRRIILEMKAVSQRRLQQISHRIFLRKRYIEPEIPV